jgi:peptidoglycan/xylan/chitin deacetylase (PgdA/CDA1 family)
MLIAFCSFVSAGSVSGILGLNATFPYYIQSVNSVSTLNKTWLDFDGISGVITYMDNDYFSPALYNISVCTWFKLNVTPSGTRDFIFGKAQVIPPLYEWELSIETNGKLALQTRNLSSTAHGYVESPVISNGVWHHVCALYLNNYSLSLYLDGDFVNQDTTFSGIINQTNRPFLIGARDSNFYFNGSIDEVEFFYNTISPSMISYMYSSDTRSNSKFIPVIAFHQYNSTGEYAINESYFSQVMNLINSLGYDTITDIDYLNYTKGFISLPSKPIMITWDDSDTDGWISAAKIMSSYSYKSVMFVDTSSINWTEVNILINTYNWSIGSHGVNHCNMLTSCNSTTNWTYEFSISKTNIIGNTTKIPYSFRYPNSAWNSSTQSYCALNYSLCFGDPNGIPNLYRNDFLFKNTNLTNGEAESMYYDNATVLNDFNFLLNNSYGIQFLVFKGMINENSGSVVHDSSINSINGTITGNISWNNDNSYLLLSKENYDISKTDNSFTINALNNEYLYSHFIASYSLITVNFSYFATSVSFILDLLPIVAIILIYIIFLAIQRGKINIQLGLSMIVSIPIIFYAFDKLLNAVLGVV